MKVVLVVFFIFRLSGLSSFFFSDFFFLSVEEVRFDAITAAFSAASGPFGAHHRNYVLLFLRVDFLS